ncbi:putative uncharacterized protein DDB_G0282499, partial [Lucilia sericata]|uniref:putative uncharacterized protein DDB_G0282499 n=1 Tax=Lucilia sericata TaxID=13632 RepID=UPI0018A86E4F
MKTFKALTQKKLTVLLAIIFITQINAVISQQEDELQNNRGWRLANNTTNIEPLMVMVVGDIEATAISSTSKTPYLTNNMADINQNPDENEDMNNNNNDEHANDNDNNITPQAYKYYSNQQEKHKTLNQLQHNKHKNHFQHAGQQLSGHNTKQHRHHQHHPTQHHQRPHRYRYPANHYSSKYPFEKHKHHVKHHRQHHQQPEVEQQPNQHHHHNHQSPHSKTQIKQKLNPSLSSYENKQLTIATEMLKQPTIENYKKEKLTTSTYAKQQQHNRNIDDFVNITPEDFNYQNDDDFEMLWQNDNERESLNRNQNVKHYSITTPATKHNNKHATMLTPYYDDDGDDATTLSLPFVNVGDDDISISSTTSTPYSFASDAQTFADDFFFDNDNKFPYLTHLYHQPHHTQSQGQGAQMGDYFAASPRSGRHRGRATSHIIASHNLLHSVGSKKFRSLPETDQEYQMQRLLYAPPTQRHWPVKREAVVEGDVILGGLMMVHSREDTITCGPIMPQGGIQALEAMLYTIDRINEMDLLPNITLGAHILDDCDKDSYGLEMAVDFIKGSISNIDDAEYHCNKTTVRKVISGVVGAASSVTSIQVANLLRLFRIPQVSFFSTSPELSNKQRFEYFSRTIPSDHYQVKAMVEIVKRMGWSYVSIIYEESNYGIKAFEELEELLARHSICIAVKEKLVKDSGVADEIAYDNIVQKLLTKPRAR